MKLKLGLLFATLFVIISWYRISQYTPSKDGVKEQSIALADMQRYCQASRLNCEGMRVVERHEPTQAQKCTDDNGRLECEVVSGFWTFVVRLNSSKQYEVAVLPDASSLLMSGLGSQISPIEEGVTKK